MTASLSRRDLLAAGGVAGGWLAVAGALGQTAPATNSTPSASSDDGPYSLPALPYGYSDLEPHLSAQIVKLHHDVHHAGYVKGANEALAGLARIRREGGEAVRQVRAVTDSLTFNLAGHLLHCVYWNSMARDGGGAPAADTEIAKMLKRDFGPFEAFVGQFSAAAAQVQGSGWAILGYEPLARRLLVMEAEKHQNWHGPGVVPLLALDVWEHAYYLQYQNQRTSYIKAFFNVIHWADADARLRAATGV